MQEMTTVTVTDLLRFHIYLYGATEAGSMLGGMKTPAATICTMPFPVM